MNDFLFNFFGSLLAGIVLIGIMALISEKARWILVSILGRILNIDIEYVFKNKNVAGKDIDKELQRAHHVGIITGRGTDLVTGIFDDFFLNLGKGRKCRILLPETNFTEGDIDWAGQRRDELSGLSDPLIGKDRQYHEHIDATAKFFEKHIELGNIELKRYSIPIIGRVVVTDRVAYFTPYRTNELGRNLRIFKCRKGGDLYNFFNRLFEQLWNYEKYQVEQ